MTEPATPDIAKRDIRRRRSLMAQTTLRLFGRTGAVIGAIWIGFTALLAVFAPFLANSRPLAWKVNDPELGVGWQFPLFEMLTPLDVMFLVGFVFAVGLAAGYRAGGKLFWVWLGTMCSVFVCSMLFYLIAEHRELANAITSAQNVFDQNANDANKAAIGDATLGLVKWWVQWVFVGAIVAGLLALSVTRLRHSPQLLVVMAGLIVLVSTVLLLPGTRIELRKDAPGYRVYREALADGRAEKAYFALIPYSPNDDIAEQTTVDAATLQVGVRNVLRPPGAHPAEADIALEMQLQAETLYGVRLYELTDQEGEPHPLPKTREQAHDTAELLWQAYQAKPTYIPARGRPTHKNVVELLDRFDQIPLQTRYHVMGTTANGQDLASRMIHGARIALYIGFIATGIAVVIGVIIGGFLGYFAGWVDLIGLRLVEVFASIPVIMLLIMIVAFYGRSLVLMMVVLGLTGWVGYAYFVRAEFLKLRKMDYVMAARAAGTPLHRILFQHMLPNGVAPVLVGASFGIAGAIMTEATLSFLGLGLEPTDPSWGQMLDQARQGGAFSWWMAIFPGMAIFLTVFAYNLIGEALRDVIDPRTAK